MNLADVKKSCSALGAGWRLPTKEELNFYIKRKMKLVAFQKVIIGAAQTITLVVLGVRISPMDFKI